MLHDNFYQEIQKNSLLILFVQAFAVKFPLGYDVSREKMVSIWSFNRIAFLVIITVKYFITQIYHFTVSTFDSCFTILYLFLWETVNKSEKKRVEDGEQARPIKFEIS